MVRKYIRKTERQSWANESMQKAIEAVISGSMGYQKAADSFGVPRSTLVDRVKKQKAGASLEDAARKGYKIFFSCSFTKFDRINQL